MEKRKESRKHKWAWQSEKMLRVLADSFPGGGCSPKLPQTKGLKPAQV